jgi:hypothetical protein
MQQTIQKCKTLIMKPKYLTQMKALSPMLNAQIKIHTEYESVRPVVNNIHAPTYKIAQCLNHPSHGRYQFTSQSDITTHLNEW